MQPQQGDVPWMQKPQGPPGCPPGLEYLAMIDQLVVKQQVELLEALTGWESKNKYRIFNSVQQQVYFAKEDTECCMRMCCGPNRGFVINITDNLGQLVIRLERKFKCCAGCCWCANADCCAFELAVEAPPGEIVGYVRQEQSCWKPNMTLRTSDHEILGRIEGPCCQCSGPCCSDVEFPVASVEGHVIGKITKQWTGFIKESFTDADTFGITFPMDMDVRMKAVMIGALFLVDFMYFEQKKNNNNN